MITLIGTFILVSQSGEYVYSGWKETHVGRQRTLSYVKNLNQATVFQATYSTRKWTDEMIKEYNLTKLPAYEERKVFIGIREENEIERKT